MNSPIPFGAQQFLNHFNLQPSVVKGPVNTATTVHKRYLYTKLYSVYRFKLPENWPINWFRFWLFNFGSIAAIYTKEFGWTVQPYSITGLDLYYQPASIMVYNHMFKDAKAGKIGVNAEIIHIMDDYFSLDDLVTKYAVELAQIDKDFNVNLMNANVALLAETANKKDADAIKTAYAEATEGKPMIAINDKITKGNQITTLINAPKQNYLGNELLQARRNVINQFLTDIGIPNFNMEKKAQQNRNEISENDDETKAVCIVILENLQKCFKRLNRISGLECSVTLRPNYRKEGETNGEDNTVRDVTV